MLTPAHPVQNFAPHAGPDKTGRKETKCATATRVGKAVKTLKNCVALRGWNQRSWLPLTHITPKTERGS